MGNSKDTGDPQVEKDNISFHVEKPAKVFYAPFDRDETTASVAAKTKHLLQNADLLSLPSKEKLTAIKQHLGEKGNEGFIKPQITRLVADMIKSRGAYPLLVETNTLYRGQRSNSYHHLLLAHEHGFSIENIGIPLIIMDGVHGQNQHPVRIPGKHFETVHVVPDLPFFDSLFVLSHVKGHMASGMGGAIKNLSMGFASRAGKLAQHADFKPRVDPMKCQCCELCVSYCPQEAIESADCRIVIDLEKCIGCGECYTACRSEAIEFSWGAGDRHFQEKMAEYAFGAIIRHPRKVGFVNFFCHITKQCDCWGGENPVLCDDVGLFASMDPVAVDRASYDVGIESLGEDIFKRFWPNLDPLVQLRHAENIGMGTQEYQLIEV